MPCYKLEIAYDGTNYGGWQIQPNARSIQAEIEKALSIFNPTISIRIHGSGRTDAGVHAKGQIAHFHLPYPIDPVRFLHSLNGLLPLDIRALSVQQVSDHFHARYSAIGKVYHYHLHLDRITDPFEYRYSWHLPVIIDISKLEEAAKMFIGTHDFTSFANEAHLGSAAKNPIRTLTRLDVFPMFKGMRLEFEGNGFLYKMVRNIVGTLVEVGKNKISSELILEMFAAKDRRKACQAAPPQGLFLMQVHYENE